MTAPTSPAGWVDAAGTLATSNPNAFNAALQRVSSVAVVFGGGWYYPHGLYVSPGAARFILTNYNVK